MIIYNIYKINKIMNNMINKLIKTLIINLNKQDT